MLKRRLIPVLFLKDGWMVRSEGFNRHNYVGDPVAHVDRMVEWRVDELIVIDIGSEASTFEHHRTDYRHAPVTTVHQFIERAGVQCNMPLTFGGRIRSMEEIELRILSGADKVTLNTAAADNPGLITEAAHSFGAQAIVISIDYRVVDGRTRVYVDRGRRDVDAAAADWARRVEDLGAGEILLSSIDRDGKAQGYDLDTISEVTDAVGLPVIACAGAGANAHFLEALENTGASAVAAGNIFHFKENAYPAAKAYLKQHLQDIR